MSVISESEKLNVVAKFIILLLGEKNSEPIPGPLHLQKEMFLLQGTIPKLADKIDYKSDFSGPHSDIVSNQIDRLVSLGIINVKYDKIELTQYGLQVVDILKEKIDEEDAKIIKDFKEFLNDLTKDELLAFIYFAYPYTVELEKESDEYLDLLSKRKNIALSMYYKDKIGVQKAAELSGEYLGDFLKELKH